MVNRQVVDLTSVRSNFLAFQSMLVDFYNGVSLKASRVHGAKTCAGNLCTMLPTVVSGIRSRNAWKYGLQ